MPINKNEITKEMIEKAMQCKTADELIALAKTEGCEERGRRQGCLLYEWLRVARPRYTINYLTALL